MQTKKTKIDFLTYVNIIEMIHFMRAYFSDVLCEIHILINVCSS